MCDYGVCVVSCVQWQAALMMVLFPAGETVGANKTQ